LSSAATPPFDTFALDRLPLTLGGELRAPRLAHRVHGRADGPVVLACTAFAATPLDLGYLAAPGGPLDPGRVRLVQVEQLGNGRSTSPSNAADGQRGPDFPALTIQDDVAIQAALLDHLGIARVDAVIGASMGGQQALAWAALHPGRVGRAVCIAGNARTTLYGQLFLRTVADALRSDPAFAEGRYTSPPLLGLSRLSETWAPFALSPRFFSTGRHQAHADMAADDLDGFLAKWRTRYHAKDANDLLCHLAKWSRFDILPAAGGAVAPILLAPIATDIYFHPDDARDQAAAFPKATVEVVESLSGHAAAFGREAEDRAAVSALVETFLHRSAD
jgi:homoserine O-acetyltransferase/O-succinyltransferase